MEMTAGEAAAKVLESVEGSYWANRSLGLPGVRLVISISTCFDDWEEFKSEEQVREFFTPEQQQRLHGRMIAISDPEILAAFADVVIANGWHMAS